MQKTSTASSSLGFCLEYNSHKLNMIDAFDDMLKNENMVDVILSCQGKTIKAHRMILSAGSIYFRNIFSAFTNPLHFPVVIIKDMSFDDLKAIVEFLYRGKVIVPVEQVASLSKSAQSLFIKGLEKYFNKSAIVESLETAKNKQPSPGSSGSNHTPKKEAGNKRKKRKQKLTPTRNDDAYLNGIDVNTLDSDEELLLEINNNKTRSINDHLFGIKTEHNYDINYTDADCEEDDFGPPHLEMQVNAFEHVEAVLEEDEEDECGIVYENLYQGPPEIKIHSPRQNSIASMTRLRTDSLSPSTSASNLQFNSTRSTYSDVQEPRGVMKSPMKVIPRKVRNTVKRRGRGRGKRVVKATKTKKRSDLVSATGKTTLPIKVEPNAVNDIFKCNFCRKMFSQESSLNYHIKRFHSEDKKEHVCNYCGKRYSWPSGLYKHLRIHRPPRQYLNS